MHSLVDVERQKKIVVKEELFQVMVLLLLIGIEFNPDYYRSCDMLEKRLNNELKVNKFF